MKIPFPKTQDYRRKQELVGQLVQIYRSRAQEYGNPITNLMASLNQFESDDYRALFEEEILPNLSVYATLLDRLGLHDPESIPVSDRARVLESAMKERLPTLLQRSRNYHEKADAYERLKNSFRLYFYGTSDLEKWVEMMKP